MELCLNRLSVSRLLLNPMQWTIKLFGMDYDLGPDAVQTFTITPDQQSVSIGVNIYDVGLTRTLQAKLVSK